MSAHTVTFIENNRPKLIRVFQADSIGEAFDEALKWDAEQEYPGDWDAIQIQPSWVLWQEVARKSA